jgi:hypothetical protein
VYRTVHTASAEQRVIGGVDYRVNPLFGDVASNDFQSVH